MKRKLKVLSLVLLGLGASLCAKAANPDAYSPAVYTTNTLFIEAEDCDYQHGKFVTGVHIGMDGPYPGGSYTNLGDINDLNFDWNVQNSGAPNGQVYRVNTLLSAGKEKGSAGNNRGTFTVTDWWTLGWTSGGDWQNYTRPFPSTPQDYFVFGHFASGGANIGIELDQVTSGVGMDDSVQVKKALGVWNPGRATAGWDSLEIFPLTDTNGFVITLNLSGTNTLRLNLQTNSAEDLDYFAFVPATAPLFAAKAGTRDIITASLIDTPSIKVDATTLAFTLNGTTVTGTAIKTNGTTTATINLSTLLAQGATNTLAVTYKDLAAASHSASYSFVVNTFITTRTIFIEFEDCDYNHGQFVSTGHIGMDGPYPGGSYTNLGTTADSDFDWHVGSSSGPNGQVYRINTTLSAGKPNGSAGSDRGYFQVQNWWTLGWNSGGDWSDYTRPFPASNQWYEAYAHLASGGGAIDIRLDLVTAGVGQQNTNQVLKPLGHWAPGRATAGWDSLEIFPLITGPGGKKTVVNINGMTTLRASQIGTEDMDYMAFVPVTLPAAVITVSTQPQSQTIPQGNGVSLTVAATTTSQYGISYQWKKNGTAIPGANNPTYTTPLLQLSDSGVQYTVVISSPGAPDVPSSTATITVIKDTTPPTVVSAGSLTTWSNTSEITIIFNKPLSNTTAAVAGNYTLDNGGTVSAARYVPNSSGFTKFAADGTPTPDVEQGVVLSVSTLDKTKSYHVTVKNVSDYLGNVQASLTVPVNQSTFTWVPLGTTGTNAAYPNGFEDDAFFVGTNGVNSFNLVNGGNAFWGVEDDITFVYEAITGDFDKTTQVEWNDPSSNWARAGIAVRETVKPSDAMLDPTDGSNTNAPRYQIALSDPVTKFNGQGANDSYETNHRLSKGAATTSSNGGGTVNYPSSFVRLKRYGNMISMFYSYTGQWWQPLGTVDFGDPTVSPDGPLAATMFVGPTLGVENLNITGQGGTTDQEGAFAARFRNYANMAQKAAGKETYSVGLHFGANEAGSQLGTNDVAGADVVAQPFWNNLFGNAPAVASGIVADQSGTMVATTIGVGATGSGNTWASHGPRGENDGEFLTGNDAVLMTGYLDTGNATTTYVGITNIPSALTSPGYDVVVYGLGGISARGGGYYILDAGGNVLRPSVQAQAPANPTNLTMVIPDPNTANWPIGIYIVFTNLQANSIIVVGDTANGHAFGGTPRAPINAIQLVSPAGLFSGGTGTTPTVKVALSGNTVTITFTGTLYSATQATGPYTPVAGAQSPFTVTLPASAPATFYRAHQ